MPSGRSSRGTISTKKSNMSVFVMAAEMSLRCSVRRLHSSELCHARSVSSKINISQAYDDGGGATVAVRHTAKLHASTLANKTGASALIMRTSSSDFMICGTHGIVAHTALWHTTGHACLFYAGQWQLRVFKLARVAAALLHLLHLGLPKLHQRFCVRWVGCYWRGGYVHGHVARQDAALWRLRRGVGWHARAVV